MAEDPAQAIVDFWFLPQTDPSYGKARRDWFAKDPLFDNEIRHRFLADYERAAAGSYRDWRQDPLRCLALIVLLDQFPRNLFRGTPRAFATDSLALEVARHAVAQDFDQRLVWVQRWFVYLPFEHSEDLADQRQAVQLFEGLRSDPGSQEAIEYAYKHLHVIERFGRFPHRNALLGRESTPEEIAFLQQPGSSF